jgi:hypothetical protein
VIGFTIIGALLLLASIVPATGFVRDIIRLRRGQKFRRLELGATSGAPSGDGFLGIFNVRELKLLQESATRWPTKSLPDIRKMEIRPDLAQIYWRIASAKLNSREFLSELAALCGSVALGITATSAFSHFLGSRFQLVGAGLAYFVASVVLVVVICFAIAWKTAARRRWEDVIEIYREAAWPDDVNSAPLHQRSRRWGRRK